MKWLLSFVLVVLANGSALAQVVIYPEAKHGKGELKYIDQLPVAILQGTPEEIGEQYGALVVKPAAPLLRTVPEFLKSMGLSTQYPELIKVGRQLVDHTSPAFRAEMKAAAKSSGFDEELMIFGNTIADIYKLGGCSTVIVEPSRSSTGHPIFGRNFDWPPYKNLGDHTLVVVFKPQGKHAFASIGIPPITGIISGMNDVGLCLTMNEIRKTADGSIMLDPEGLPLVYLYRQILEECSTVEEAETLMRKLKRPTCAAITVCDRKGGAVFEITPKNVMVRRSVEGICCCTNHFRCDGVSVTKECWRYGKLEKLQMMNGNKLGVAEVTLELRRVAQILWTMQMMVFEPEPLRLHLAYTSGLSAKKSLRKVELAPLFERSASK